MSRLRALVVDDEPLAREVIRDLLAQDPDIEIAGECGDGEQALAFIRDQRPDLVFLDVEMPGLGGLEVAEALTPDEIPALVFVTAYGHYAISAFKVAALDYLVKPFSDARFSAALQRAKQRIREQRLGQLAEKMVAFGSALEQPESSGSKDQSLAKTLEENRSSQPASQAGGYLARIPVQIRGRSRIFKTEEVWWIESDDYYSRIHTAEGAFLIRASLSSFERRLDPGQFLRIHRKAIININEAATIDHLVKGSCLVVLTDGSRLPISRARKKRALDILAPRLTR